jgi:hypothetical protein
MAVIVPMAPPGKTGTTMVIARVGKGSVREDCLTIHDMLFFE